MHKTSDVSIQQLSLAQLDLMRSLLKLFGTAFEEKEAYCNKQPEDPYLEKLLGKDYFITLVATQAKQVLGGLVAYELIKFEQQRSEIYIYDLAVDEPYRRMGIATKLINTLKKIANERDAYVIYVQADYGDEPAIKLYEKLGQREDVLHFDIAPKTMYLSGGS